MTNTSKLVMSVYNYSSVSLFLLAKISAVRTEEYPVTLTNTTKDHGLEHETKSNIGFRHCFAPVEGFIE
jgi:hypothetical protein